jgi:hypothetical protein
MKKVKRGVIGLVLFVKLPSRVLKAIHWGAPLSHFRLFEARCLFAIGLKVLRGTVI